MPIMPIDCMELLKQYEETERLLDIQIVDFRPGYERAFPDLLRALPGMAEAAAASTPLADIRNPFKGLEPFQQTDAALFFGREELVARLVDRVHECRFIAVVGASGSGKSSLVRAGLIPAVRAGKIAGSESWPLVMFTPGPQPVQALAARLLSIVGGNRLLPELVALINAESDNLYQLIAGAMVDHPEDARFVIVIDQFEEVFSKGIRS
ncbi:MAG: ATP-binding protein [Chloroflexi bacterium]|nr:ATP-binding protein [Chloroflexota bacterium]